MIGLAEKVRPSGTVLQPHLHLICICTLPPCRPLAAAAAAAAAAACYARYPRVDGEPAETQVHQRCWAVQNGNGAVSGRYYDCTRVVLLHGVVL